MLTKSISKTDALVFLKQGHLKGTRTGSLLVGEGWFDLKRLIQIGSELFPDSLILGGLGVPRFTGTPKFMFY